MQPFSCPEKEFYFRRSNAARNWRRNNFKVVNTVSVPSFNRSFSHEFEDKHIITYDDFYLHWENIGDRSCDPDCGSDDSESDSKPDGVPDKKPDTKTVSRTFTWQFVWADLLGQDGLQVGSLTRPVGSQIGGVLAASSKVTF